MTNPYDPFHEGELHERYARASGTPTADEDYLAELSEEEHAKAAAEADAERHARAVAEVAARIRARADAEAIVAAAARPPMPEFLRLDQILSRPIEPVRFRVEGLWPVGGRIMLAAQAKTGKTTLRDNLIRCLADGARFLDKFDVEPVPGCVGVIDTELPEMTFANWLRDQHIRNEERVWGANLRGRVTAFDLLDDGRRGEWVQVLRAARVRSLIIDCLGPILAAHGLDESKGVDVGRWLNALEDLGRNAGIDEMLIIHHMGHGEERSRGASRLRDWPDAEWRLLRRRPDGDEDAKPDPTRYFAAIGRDVDLPESALVYDPLDRRLRFEGGNRATSQARVDVRAVAAAVREHPGESQTRLTEVLREEVPQKRMRRALGQGVRDGVFHEHPGERNSRLFWPADDCAKCVGPQQGELL